MNITKDQKLLKGFQTKKTQIALDKFLERPPIRQGVTIDNSRRSMHKAKETSGDVKLTLEDRYTSEEPVPLTSRTTERRRAFSDLRAATRSYIDRTPHLMKQRRSSDTAEEKEIAVKTKEKDTEIKVSDARIKR